MSAVDCLLRLPGGGGGGGLLARGAAPGMGGGGRLLRLDAIVWGEEGESSERGDRGGDLMGKPTGSEGGGMGGD